MAVCRQCDERLALLERRSGICFACIEKNKAPVGQMTSALSLNTMPTQNLEIEDKKFVEQKMAAIMLTTETSPNLEIAERLEIITAECVLGMNIFKDIGSSLRDLVGGRNEAYQKALKDARKAVLLDLRREALLIGADAVVAVDLDYSEISGGGKSMLFLVASGTAVRLATSTHSTP